MPPSLIYGFLVCFLAACSQQFVLPDHSYQTPRSASRGVAADLSAELVKEIPIGSGYAPVLIGSATTAASGEITKSGRELQTFLLLDLKALMPDRVVERIGGDIPIRSANVISATVAYERPDPKKPDDSWFKVNLVFNNKEGENKGLATFRINARHFDPTPSRFFQQSPIFYGGHIKKAVLTDARPTPDHKVRYLIEKEAKNDRGIVAYEAGQYASSQKIFREVAAEEDGNLLALSGVYQSSLALGEKKEADIALDQMIDAGIKQGALSFKFLFRVRSAAFRDDFEISEHYTHWISRVASRLSKTDKCLRIEGHASHTGSPEFNEGLSRKRAERVAQLLIQESPELRSRIKSFGLGFSKNIVGSGTDDATDAIDRRVEFVLVPC